MAVKKKVPKPTDIYVGSRIRMQRNVIGMSQEKLGDALNLTFQQVQKYEKGTNRVGSSRLQEIAHILGVPVGFFFEGGPNEAAPKGAASPDQLATYFFQTNAARTLAQAYIRIDDPLLRLATVSFIEAVANACERVRQPSARKSKP